MARLFAPVMLFVCFVTATIIIIITLVPNTTTLHGAGEPTDHRT
jgi:hypothetical protein